jgi:transglutaminase-like putative cysteine protease
MAQTDDITPGMLRISHSTTYRYSKPVKFLPHRLVIRPREGHDLRVESMKIAVSAEHELIWSRDIFGNSVATLYFGEATTELRIESDVLIQRFPMSSSQRLASATPVLYPPQYDPLEQAIITAYIAPVYPEDSAAVQQWLKDSVAPSTSTPVDEIVLELTRRIFETIQYRRRDEKGVQSPAATLALGNGSCRDVATLLMEAARHLHIAGRFASGYLDCPATRAARGSTHAWTEVYLPNLGWRGFDSTTGQHCTFAHIPTGVSNHPRGVMPITGRFIGDAGSYLEMTAAVSFSEPP